MAIKPPNYQKDAIPTLGGWRHPKTNELLVSTKISQAQIDEYNGVVSDADPKVFHEPTEVEVIQTFVEMMPDAQEIVEDLNSKTKAQLEEIGREYGEELDRRRKKEDLVMELTSIIQMANDRALIEKLDKQDDPEPEE